MSASRKKSGSGLASNRRALHDYHVLQRFEAGIALTGTEVKSIKAAAASLAGSFAVIDGNEILIHNMNVPAYEFGNRFNHVPTRPRRLLLHRAEIHKLRAQVEQKGNALIPLKLYLKRGKVKVELGLCRGKQTRDKRETLRRKTMDREAQRAMSNARR